MMELNAIWFGHLHGIRWIAKEICAMPHQWHLHTTTRQHHGVSDFWKKPPGKCPNYKAPTCDQQCLLHKEVAQNCIYLNLCFSPRFGDGFDCAVWLAGWDLPPSHSIQADELADWPHTFILHFELRTIVPQCSRQKEVNECQWLLHGLWPFQRLFLDYFPALVLLPSCFAKAISEVGLIYLNPEGNGFNGRAREIGCCDWDLPWLAFLYFLHSAWIVTVALMYYEECTWRMHIILIIHIVEFAPIFTG